MFSIVANFLWISWNLKFTYFCVNILITVYLRVLKIKLNFCEIKISNSNFLSSSYGNALKKLWGMENIPHWIWPISSNWLAENKRKWAGHGLSNSYTTGCPFGLHLLCMRPEVFMIPWTFRKLTLRASLTLHETRSIHDSIKIPKIEFIS